MYFINRIYAFYVEIYVQTGDRAYNMWWYENHMY